jgi:hypothetical protein
MKNIYQSVEKFFIPNLTLIIQILCNDLYLIVLVLDSISRLN